MRVANAIKEAKNDSSLDSARNGGTFSVGAKDSTLTRQRLEKLLYHRVLKIREEMTRNKIREVEVTTEAHKLLQQKQVIEAQVAAIEKQLDAEAPVRVAAVARERGHEGPARGARDQGHEAQGRLPHPLGQWMALLNEVVDNCTRLINKPQAECDALVAEAVRSFAITEIKGKFAGTHTQGAWRQALRETF